MAFHHLSPHERFLVENVLLLKPCADGASMGITCEYSATGCIRNCNATCWGYLPAVRSAYDSASGGCGNCGEKNQAQTMSAYDQKIDNAQFGGCAGCGSDERVKY